MGFWQNDDSLTKYTTAPNTRSLSVTSNLKAISDATDPYHRNDENATTTMAILFYESPNTSVAVLSRLPKECSYCLSHPNDNPTDPSDPRNDSWIANNICGSSVPPTGQPCAGPLQAPAHPPFASSQYTGVTNFGVITFYFNNKIMPPSKYILGSTTYFPTENPETLRIGYERKY